MTTSDALSPQTADDGAVPLTILTGFLGAGKTTLLNRLLNGDHGLRVAVLVNDFGAVNIDADLVVGVEDDMISLANGCVCCQIRDDLVEAVDKLLASSQPPEYIVLEASGVADPAGIWATFGESTHRDRIRLDSVTCVVDAEQIFAHADDAPELVMLKARQIGFADLVVLNKVDLAGQRQVERVRHWIGQLMNRVRIVEASYCDVPYEVLLGAGRFDPSRQLTTSDAVDFGADGHVRGDDHEHDRDHDRDHDHGAGGEDHGSQFATWAFESDRPFSLDALRVMVRRELPGSVYRCKGVVYAEDEPDSRFVLHTVGRRSEISVLDHWGDRPPRSRIVAIGDAERLDEEALQQSFDSCLA